MTYNVRFNAVLNEEADVYSMKFGVEAASPEEAALIVKGEMDEQGDVRDFGWYFTKECQLGDQDDGVGIDEDDKIEVDEIAVVTQTIEFRITLKGAA